MLLKIYSPRRWEGAWGCCGLPLLVRIRVQLPAAPPVVAVTSSVNHAKTVEEAVNQGVREETRHCSRHGRNFSWLDGMTIRNSVTADSRKDGTLEQSSRWLGRSPHKRVVAGSSPACSTNPGIPSRLISPLPGRGKFQKGASLWKYQTR